MDIPFVAELPPVPDCFSKLLVNESEMSALPSQPWRESENQNGLKYKLKLYAKDSVPGTTLVMGGWMDGSVTSETTVMSMSVHGVHMTRSQKTDSGFVEDEDVETADPENRKRQETESNLSSSPVHSSYFSRLNTSLARLKEEMVDLRHLDMSLLCQLLSLNEAIQDFKSSICDRCSECTGSEYTSSEYASSEYSLGGGMGSRVESFSSLNEESVGNGEFGQGHDNKNNSGDFATGYFLEEANHLAESTSSLLKQITALTQRAEDDFY
ncbi:uncharacterized protein LOC143280809 [Babylonia areolata]|uniref:uncharacterized protein LOC143280809 n=1 Tax=Babylonia areolata TaxID=304850 RepID=UPI003FD2B840